MRRQQLADLLAERHTYWSRKKVSRISDMVLNAIVESLREGRRVEIRGFGVFFCKERCAYKLCNPRDGQLLSVEARRVPRFRMARGLGEKVNSSDG